MPKLTNDMKKPQINTKAIERLADVAYEISPGQTVAYVMRHCGATYQQIADVFGVTRQGAHNAVTSVTTKIGGERK